MIRMPCLARSLVLVLLVAVGLSSTGCLSRAEPSKEEKMLVVAEDETKRAVEEHARWIASVVGMELKPIGLNSAPCTGRRGETSDYIYTTQGVYQIFVPEEQHAAILEDLRQRWQAQGYSIKKMVTASGRRGSDLTVETPDGFSLSVMGTFPPTALALMIHSPCRQSPTKLF